MQAWPTHAVGACARGRLWDTAYPTRLRKLAKIWWPRANYGHAPGHVHLAAIVQFLIAYTWQASVPRKLVAMSCQISDREPITKCKPTPGQSLAKLVDMSMRLPGYCKH